MLRIEDTDLERSTRESVDAILEGLEWLGIDWDEGPAFQMQRLARYKEVAEQLIAAGHAYRDYMPKDELDALRAQQAARGEKPRYDRAIGQRYRGEGPAPIRFKTPQEGHVGWNDLVKGEITFPNAELDDLVLLRADGVPTYNFGVVVDDLDMNITHVIRGDDHVNNTPRQIHIFSALGKALPEFAHVPMILGADGERLSKRHGATSVLEYKPLGYLPEALLNYLARLGWSHGDDEIFSKDDFVKWFDLRHVSRSPAQFNPEKLAWLNQQYMKTRPAAEVSVEASRISPEFKALLEAQGAKVISAVELYSPRASTLAELVATIAGLLREPSVSREVFHELVSDNELRALVALRKSLERLSRWDRASLAEAIKRAAAEHKLKMPQIAMPLRYIVTGQKQTPSIDAVLELLDRNTVLARMDRYLESR